MTCACHPKVTQQDACGLDQAPVANKWARTRRAQLQLAACSMVLNMGSARPVHSWGCRSACRHVARLNGSKIRSHPVW